MFVQDNDTILSPNDVLWFFKYKRCVFAKKIRKLIKCYNLFVLSQ